MFLISAEGIKIEIDQDIMELSQLFKEVNKEEIQLDFSLELITKVIQFCEYYINNPLILPDPEPIKTSDLNQLISPEWYVNYIDINSVEVFKLMNIANCFEIDPLIDLTCIKIATLLKGKKSIEIRDQFDFSEEEKINN